MLPILLCTALTAPPERPNVLLIVSDDLTNNTLGCYGSAICKSPNIDALAAKSVRFDRAYCQFPLCNPSRSSFLTGLRPDTIRIYENSSKFRVNYPASVSIGETFQKAGYNVARIGKLYHYGVPAEIGTNGLDDPTSWQKVVNPKGADKDDEDAGRIFTMSPMNKGSARFGGTLSWFASDAADAEHTDGKIAAATVQEMKAAGDKPFFLACGFFRPHTPYVAPKSYFAQYPAEKLPLPAVPAGHRDAGPAAAFGSYQKYLDNLTDDLRRQALQAYYASTTYMDSQVGVLLKALDELTLNSNTIVVFISDHGYHLGEHGLWQKQSLFENACRVPLIIYDPRGTKPGFCRRTVELTDLHATLADLCNLPAPPSDGKSLKPLLKQPDSPWERAAITQQTRYANKANNTAEFRGYTIRNERYRYTTWDNAAKGEQLYDYESDPGELKNLAADPQYAKLKLELVAQLKARLAEKK
jgi:iduronate 2-sulfatase